MTDNEIIKALEYCVTHKDTCENCPCVIHQTKCATNDHQIALGLINRQKAEIERLQKVQVQYVKAYFDEFVERLKFDISLAKLDSGLLDYVIDELIETMKNEFSREADFTDLIKAEAIKECLDKVAVFCAESGLFHCEADEMLLFNYLDSLKMQAMLEANGMAGDAE